MLKQEQINFFIENGYLVVNSETFFEDNFISDLKKICKKTFLNYDNTELSNNIPKDNYYTNNHIYYVKNTSKKNDNKLFGIRATINNWSFKNGLSNYIENKNLLFSVKQLLNTNSISLHTSALIKVYPGCEGEPMKLHVDTPGFVDDTIKFVNKNKFVLNTLIYLNDVDKNLAPMRVCPKSHNDFIEINNYINKKNSFNKYNNNMQASGIGVDEAMVKELGYEIKPIVGKAGTIIFMSGNLLHSATQNKTDKSRIHFNFNFSRRDHFEVRKFNYKRMINDSVRIDNFINQFQDKSMLFRSYSNSSFNIILNSYFKFKFKFKNKFQKLLEKSTN